MWHHGQMSSIRRTKSRHPERGSVRIKRIAFRNLPIHPALIVHEDYRDKFFADDLVYQCWVGEVKSAFAVSHPNPEC